MRGWQWKVMLLVLVFFALAGAASAAKWKSVAVREGALRLSPMPFGKIIARLDYGARVDILAEQGDWLRVRARQEGPEGWMHGASLIDRKIVLLPGEELEGAASEEELALGGKGFNAQVEARFKAEQKDVDYKWVDWMEQVKVPPAASQEFLARGGVIPAPGGADHVK